MGEPDVTTHHRIMPDGDPSKYGGIGINGHMVTDNRMSWHIDRPSVIINLEILRAQSDSLVNRHMVAYDTRLTDDDTRTMVDGEIFSDLCPRVDIDAGSRVCPLGEDSRQYRYFHDMQLVSHSIV